MIYFSLESKTYRLTNLTYKKLKVLELKFTDLEKDYNTLLNNARKKLFIKRDAQLLYKTMKDQLKRIYEEYNLIKLDEKNIFYLIKSVDNFKKKLELESKIYMLMEDRNKLADRIYNFKKRFGKFNNIYKKERIDLLFFCFILLMVMFIGYLGGYIFLKGYLKK
ncbi:hypothetical protein H312_02698 [Anncaliia algerae PRA339]|uniref:SPX domain-containing protein n=1 Tax=Anncaliia algerae PRA339 TaxID=1288291 RepID=A0A059EYT6_9MICR|nr:hypothetical protein H312_02698 [Anncaliia algerae PRA339]